MIFSYIQLLWVSQMGCIQLGVSADVSWIHLCDCSWLVADQGAWAPIWWSAEALCSPSHKLAQACSSLGEGVWKWHCPLRLRLGPI